MMKELCLICKKNMYIGEAYKILTSYSGLCVGYVHIKCLNEKLPKVSKEAGF
jgi:hypothetical protein